MNRLDRVKHVLGEVEAEYWQAKQKFNNFHNAHEGYAVLLEEVDELWTEVCRHKRNKENMRAEAIQVCAMALRFALDVCGTEKFEKTLAEVFLDEAEKTRG
jgi:hypothetical protein